MNIRKAGHFDKKPVLEFCKTTFSWGDYISQVWDHWLIEGNLFVITKNQKPVALCNASILKNNQVWIEGIRVSPEFRKQGLASKLIKHSESLGKKNFCKVSKMLIETKNRRSLSLAKKLNYKKEKKLYLFSVVPKKVKFSTNVKFFKSGNKVSDLLLETSFVSSWRWIPLNHSNISSLIKQKRIIYCKTQLIDGVVIFTNSDLFKKTMLVTVIFSTKNGIKKIIKFIQNLALKKNFKRIQIITTKNISEIPEIEKRVSFFLMEKKLQTRR